MQAPRFDINKAPVPPLRAEPRRAVIPVQTQGVEATSGGLIRSTLLAAAGGDAILTLFWLPAEYGIDPTGVGGMLGLTEMGDIKQQLSAEAAADGAAAASAPPPGSGCRHRSRCPRSAGGNRNATRGDCRRHRGCAAVPPDDG